MPWRVGAGSIFSFTTPAGLPQHPLMRQPPSFDATTAESLNAAFHFNIAAPFELTKAAVGHLRERPGTAIVTITSMMGHIAGRGLITCGHGQSSS